MKIADLIFLGMLIMIALLFSGCGGSSSDTPPAYTISGTITSPTSTPGLAGVTVGLTGGSTATATTDANGHYQFASLSNGAYTITPSLASYDIVPAGIGMLISDASVTGMDFTATQLVLGGSGAPRYVDNGNGTVTDNTTGLIWQKRGFAGAIKWENADDYCNNNYVELPGTGWRLPSKSELLGIVDLGQYPTIDPVFTISTAPDMWSYYWTSTTYTYFTTCAWVVRFEEGRLDYIMKTYPLFVRCVRSGP